MHLIRTYDFETVKRKYIEVTEHTPDIEKYARWIYGKHPTDESLKAYIDRGEMYVLTDGEKIAGMAAVAICQGEEYMNISWKDDLACDEAAAVHLLAICPEYRGRSLGIRILEEAMDIAVQGGQEGTAPWIPLNQIFRHGGCMTGPGLSAGGEQRAVCREYGNGGFPLFLRRFRRRSGKEMKTVDDRVKRLRG